MANQKLVAGRGYRIAASFNNPLKICFTTIFHLMEATGTKALIAIRAIKLPPPLRIFIDGSYIGFAKTLSCAFVAVAEYSISGINLIVPLDFETVVADVDEEIAADKRKAHGKIHAGTKAAVSKILERLSGRFDLKSIEFWTDGEEGIQNTIEEKVPGVRVFTCLWHVFERLKWNRNQLYKKRKNTPPDVFAGIEELQKLWTVRDVPTAVAIVKSAAGKMPDAFQNQLTRLKHNIQNGKISLGDKRSDSEVEHFFARFKPYLHNLKAFMTQIGMNRYLANVLLHLIKSPFVDGNFRGQIPLALLVAPSS